MVSRIVMSIVVGVVVAFVFYVVGTLFAQIAPTIAGILIHVSYGAGIIAGIVYFFKGSVSI